MIEQMGSKAQFEQSQSARPRAYAGRLVSAGVVRDMLGLPGELEIHPAAIQTAISTGQFEGLACFVDHVRPGEHPSLRNLFGVWHDVVWNPLSASAEGTLSIYVNDETRPVADRLDQYLQDAGEGGPVPDIGVSLVFFAQFAAGSREVIRFEQLESADLVFYPAADGRILSRKRQANGRRRTMQPLSLSAINSLAQMNGEIDMEKKQASKPQEKETAAATAVVEAPDRPAQAAAGPETAAQAAEEESRAWLQAIAEQSAQTLITASGLPPVVQKRLNARRYGRPQEVRAAIKAAQAELQALDEAQVVQLGSRPERESIGQGDGLEDAGRHLQWFFGVPEAQAPPGNLRRLDALYVALTGDEAFQGVFNGERVMLAGATTSTLANMAVDAMNKVIQAQFSQLQHWRWYESIAWPTPNDGSVQTMKLITMGGIGNLPTVAEGASYAELSTDDQKETAAFVKKGGYVGITLEMIRNSNLIEIQAVPRGLALAALRTRSAAVSSIFTDNSGVGPTLDSDSTALFHANHNNVDSTAFGTTAAAWRAARAECFAHAEVNSGKAIGIFPKFGLFPAELYDTALSVFGYGDGVPTTYTPEAVARNAADPRPVPLVVPDWTDANDWAYIVDPQMMPVIHISYAQARGGGRHPAPELFSVTNENQGLLFTNDTLPIKVRDWFAVGVNGPRGIGKRNVA